MNEIILVAFIVISMTTIGGLIWLIMHYKKLKQDFLRLNESVQSNNQDIAGLCSAAVFVDKRISDNLNQLKSVVEKIDELEEDQQHQNEPQISSNHPYHNAIQRVRNGANSGDLIQDCGVSREEAELLIRLHGHV